MGARGNVIHSTFCLTGSSLTLMTQCRPWHLRAPAPSLASPEAPSAMRTLLKSATGELLKPASVICHPEFASPPGFPTSCAHLNATGEVGKPVGANRYPNSQAHMGSPRHARCLTRLMRLANTSAQMHLQAPPPGFPVSCALLDAAGEVGEAVRVDHARRRRDAAPVQADAHAGARQSQVVLLALHLPRATSALQGRPCPAWRTDARRAPVTMSLQGAVGAHIPPRAGLLPWVTSLAEFRATVDILGHWRA